ncbi:hypothetical protein BD770DRAFT_443036 [Pilaira anomala]|nr:hypothetical protein BD770DRAFT_443036 [Pilaira anomala]
MSATTTTATTNKSELKRWMNNIVTPRHQRSIMTMTIGTFTLAAISSLFCLFFFVSLLDDFIQIVSPGRLVTFAKKQIDWTGFIDGISHQLTNFAEWEKQKRSSWYPEDHPIYHEDRFHDLISAVTTYMNDYVHQRKQQTTTTTTS